MSRERFTRRIIVVQVVRYTALLGGVFYGISHRRSLQKTKDEERTHHALHEREELVKRAKEAWKKEKETKKDSSEYKPHLHAFIFLFCALLRFLPLFL